MKYCPCLVPIPEMRPSTAVVCMLCGLPLKPPPKPPTPKP